MIISHGAGARLPVENDRAAGALDLPSPDREPALVVRFERGKRMPGVDPVGDRFGGSLYGSQRAGDSQDMKCSYRVHLWCFSIKE